MPAKRYTMPENKHEQLAPHRPTEGGFVAGREQLPSVQAKGASRGRGRPKGSTNKPKGLISKELASTILLEMKEMLPPEHFEYMRSVIRDGKAISVERELDTMILLLGRNLYPALVLEGKGESPDTSGDDFFDDDGEEQQAKPKADTGLKMPVFRKDVTERLKVWSALLAQKDKIERAKQDEGSSGKILTIAAGRGIDPGRIRLLVGVEPGSVARDLDSVEQRADEAGTLPDQISERPELLSAGEQDEADRV
jgi:hypothetical protein